MKSWYATSSVTISYSMPSKALPKHFPSYENSQILAKCQVY